MSGCPECQKRSRRWLWIIPAILLAVFLLQIARCQGGDTTAPRADGPGTRAARILPVGPEREGDA
jgi:hypothetical protein